MTEQTAPPAEEPATKPIPPRRLTRRSDGSWFAGVSAGIGAYFGIDPVIIRIAFVALTFAGGVGLGVYVVAMLLLPHATAEEEAYYPLTETVPRSEWTEKEWWSGPGLVPAIILAVVASFVVFGSFNISGGAFFGLLIVGLGIYLIADRRNLDEVRDSVQNVAQRVSGPQAPLDPNAVVDREALRAEQNARREERARQRKQNAVLPNITAGIAVCVIGVMVALSQTDVIDVTLANGIGAVMVIYGLAAVIGAWIGRGRVVGLTALLLVPALILALAVSLPLGNGFGERVWRPDSASAMASSYDFSVGKAVLDLSAVNLEPGTSKDVSVSQAIGELIVILPKGHGYEVEGEVDAGEFETPRLTRDGRDFEQSVAIPAEEGKGTFKLDAHMSLGHLQVTDDPQRDDVTINEDAEVLR